MYLFNVNYFVLKVVLFVSHYFFYMLMNTFYAWKFLIVW